MRLINADEIKNQLENGVWNDAAAEVDATPTAYNLDEVIERLKNRMKYNELVCEKYKILIQ